MAHDDYAPHPGVDEGRSGNGLGNAVTVAGAVMSLAFMTGVGIWGYKLMVRDVSGVPVVRAIEGPMRVQPEDPGGRPADHQGLAVNAVAARGEAEATPDRLVLAPRPVSLRDEDQPRGLLAAPAETMVQQASAETLEDDDQLPSIDADDEVLQQTALAKLVDELTDGVSPLESLSGDGVDMSIPAPDVDWPEVPVEDDSALSDIDAPEEEPQTPAQEAEPEVEDNVPAAVVTAPGIKRSVRPMTRPASLSTRPAAPQAADTPAARPDVAEIDPEKLIPGTRLAQLGAYDSPEVARGEWDKLAVRFGDYLEGKSRVVQKAASGGRTFYRLRAMGFEDLSDARRFCSALVAEGADCIPVVTR